MPIVVTTLNDERYIRDCLDTLLAGPAREGGVTVADRGSTDHTVDIVRSYGDAVRLGGSEPGAPGAVAAPARARYRPGRGPFVAVGTTAFGRAVAVVAPGVAPETGLHGWFLAPDDASALARYGVGGGGRPSVARAAFVASAVALAFAARGWGRVALPFAHIAVSTARAVAAGRDAGVAPHRAFLAAEIWDWTNGLGTWARLTRRRRP